MSSTVATSDDARTRKPPRLPLLDLQADHHSTRYQNELYLNRGGGGISEEDDAENFLDAQPDCRPSELQFKNVNQVIAKDERALQLELKCLLSLQKKKDRTLSSMLLGSNDFLSPRSGCLTPLSSSRGRLGSARSISLERECGSVPNSSRDLPRKTGKSHAPPLPDSLRSRFCKPEASRVKAVDALNGSGSDYQLEKGPLEQKLIEHGITPMYEPKGCQSWQNCRLRPLIPDISDLRVFLICPGPKCGGLIQCHIRRVVNAYKLYPRYKLYLTKGDFFLLSARKRKKSKTSNYVISLDEEDISYKTANYFGNVRSNFLGTKFWFYDKGDPPTIRKNKFCYNRPTDRVELGAVLYEANVFWMKGPRKITAIIPSIDADDNPYIFQPQFGSSPSILHSFKTGFDHDKMVILKNKLPEWNKQLMSYCLNFNGRATHPSSKSFQLVTEFDNDNVVLQLGKVGKNKFTMDYQYPMSALQAFSICLSRLDHKLT